MTKLSTMREAIDRPVDDGDVVALEGCAHLNSFAAGHEMIRQRKKDLVLCRLTPDVIYDQMVAAGLARELVFGWIGNPGVGSLHAIHPGVNLEEIRSEVSWQLQVREPLATTEEPSDDVLRFIRDELDPEGIYLG